jgi:putative oxidoreductase
MAKAGWSTFEPYALSLLRIVSGFLFAFHGAQKLLGWFGGNVASTMSLAWFAGVLELFGGALLVLGLFTRPVAFLLSGQMAYAYFTVHAPRGLWPIVNRGELAALYSFIFLYLFTAGSGPWSLDRIWRRKS